MTRSTPKAQEPGVFTRLPLVWLRLQVRLGDTNICPLLYSISDENLRVLGAQIRFSLQRLVFSPTAGTYITKVHTYNAQVDNKET